MAPLMHPFPFCSRGSVSPFSCMTWHTSTHLLGWEATLQEKPGEGRFWLKLTWCWGEEQPTSSGSEAEREEDRAFSLKDWSKTVKWLSGGTYFQPGRKSTGSQWRRWWALGQWRTSPTLRRRRPQRWGSPGCFPRRCGSSTRPWWTHVWPSQRQKKKKHQAVSFTIPASVVWVDIYEVTKPTFSFWSN